MPERMSFLILSFNFVRPFPSFPPPLPQSVNISTTLYLSLCHSLKEEGKTHILLLLLPLQICFPPFPLRKFPICLCAGLVERPSGVETVADAHTDWEAHTCRVLQTRTGIHIYTRCKHLPMCRNSDRRTKCAHSVIYVGVR